MDIVQTILVVDGEAFARRRIARSLARSGFRILEAPTGPEALELYDRSAEPVDLAIIDMDIPQMSGLDLAAELGRLQARLQFLYLSALSGSIATDCIRQRSPELLLVKPFSERNLLDRVFGLLGITTPSVPRSNRPDNRSGWQPTPD